MLGTRRFAWIRFLAALLLSLLGGLVAPARAQAAFDLRHAGTVFDAFTFNGEDIWLVEDGGRIRRRTPTTGGGFQWTFDTVPPEIKDLLYRVSFRPNGIGWAVGLDGWYTKKSTAGQMWGHEFQLGGINGHLELWDVDFVSDSDGWIVEEHALYRTVNGGPSEADWNTTSIELRDAAGNLLTTPLSGINLRSLDIVPAADIGMPGGPVLGLMCADPGLIFRTTDGAVWQIVFNIHSLCAGDTLPKCIKDSICTGTLPPTGISAWDIEISRNNQSNPSNPLALMVGGVGNGCGVVVRSTDYGLTWQVEPHQCACPTGHPGCNFNCAIDPLYKDDAASQTDTWRHKELLTLYSVSIFDGDNTAIASGYGGQHVVRNATTGVWEDRSSYSTDPVHAIGAVTTPMYATAADGGTAATGKGLIAGAGGFIRHTSNGGQTWATEVPGTPWRVRDLHFVNQSVGWIVGQAFRIAKSIDGGVSWDTQGNQVTPQPNIFSPSFLSISMNGSGTHGVAVGQSDYGVSDRPKIRYTEDTVGGGLDWHDAVTVLDFQQTISIGKELREVQWAGVDVGSDVFWAAGETGLIYSSTDGGKVWRQWVPPGLAWSDIRDFEIEGLAFRDTTTGIFVGTDGQEAKAFANTISGAPAWLDISPLPSANVKLLSDVDIVLNGNIAYAVGVKVVGGAELGVILTSTFNGYQFSAFAEVSNPAPPLISSCAVGDDQDSVPVLNRVEITPGGHVWVGGECGRVWQFASSSWLEHKSQTDAHIRGLSFPSDDDGFAACLSNGRSAFSVVRFHQ